MYKFVPKRRRVQWLGLLVAVFLLMQGASGQVVSLAMRAPVLPSGAIDLGASPGSQPVRLTLYLAPPADRAAALVSFLKEVQTPGSASYKQWLTPTAFAQKFGATADQLAAVTAFAQNAGLKVESASVSGLRVEVSGTVSQVETAMKPGLHGMQVGARAYYANTATPAVPTAIAGSLLAVGGLSDLPSAYPLSMATDGAAVGVAPVKDALQALSKAVEENTSRLISLSTASCLEDVDAGSQTAMQLLLRQASAQGMTVLAQTGCGPRGSAGFPSVLSEATSVAIAPGITPPATANLTELRPWWQLAEGLPVDGMRHEPDLTTSGLDALAATMMSILASEPAGADGSRARLGSVNTTLYELASEPGLYTQPDGAVDTWEAATGLGLVDLQKLYQLFPRGSLSDNVSIGVSSGYVAHGTSITFSSSVTDTSGQGGGVAPTGTVTFSTTSGVALGSATLSAGTASVSYSTLPGGNYNVQAAYSGNGTYAANTSITTPFTIAGEASVVTATATTVAVGKMVAVTITDRSASGVGTPSGTVTVIPQGTSDTNTYTGTLSGSNGTATATATVSVPAIRQGSVVMLANCVSADPSFTCYTPYQLNVTEGYGATTTALSVAPNPPVTGQATNFTATVTGPGAGFPAPTGSVVFSDNGGSLGSGALSGTTATFSTSNLTSTGTHSFSALYEGDNNYASSSSTTTSTAASSTSVGLTVNPNPPVNGSTTTLTATVTYTLTNSTTPSGTMSFYEDGALLGTGSVSSGLATFVSTTLSGTAGHTFYAVYGGDANYLTSTSPTVTTVASGALIGTTTTMTVSPNPPVAANVTTLSASVVPASGTGTPAGTVTFYEDGSAIAPVTLSGGIASYSSAGISGTATHTFYAVYGGSSSYSASTSANSVTSATGASKTMTVLAVNPNPPVSGSTTTLTATINYTLTNAAPTGTVTFYEDNTVLGTEAVSNGLATFSSTSLSDTAIHDFYVVYSGDANYTPSTSPGVNTSAASAVYPTSTTLVVSPNPPVSGSSTSLTATVGYTTISGAPTGNVEFYEDGVYLYLEPVTNGVATLISSVFGSTIGHMFYAVYVGDANFKTSTSQIVTTAPSGTTSAVATTTSLTVAPTLPVSGSTTTLTALIGYTLNNAAPTGTMAFYQDGILLGVAAVSSGEATFTSTALSSTAAHNYTAVYSGDANYMASVSAGLYTSASSATYPTTTGLTVSPNIPRSGSTTTLTATIGFTNNGLTYPTAPVTFYEDGVVLASVPVSNITNDVATFTSTTLSSTTSHKFYAVFAGDAYFETSTSSIQTTSASTATVPTRTSLLISPNPPVSGSTTTLTATVAYTSSGTSAPSGNVTFYEDGTALSTAALTSAGTAVLTSASLSSTTSHTFYALYSGDGTFETSTSSTTTTEAGSTGTEPTTTVASAASATVVSGGTVVLSATITPSAVVNSAAPTGTVAFTSSTQGALCSGAVSSDAASCTATMTTAGTQSITATYSGDSNYAASTSTDATPVTVGSATGSLTAAANPSSVMYGATVTLSSTLSSTTAVTGDPAGTVTFTLAGTAAATYTATLVGSSTTASIATDAIAAPVPGTYTVTTSCTSTNVTCTGLSAVASLTVAKGNTTTTLAALPTNPLAGQTTVLTATVAPSPAANASALAPTGTVIFYINGTPTTEPLVNGVATFATVLTAVNGNYITAVYSGDTNWNGSTSPQSIVDIAPIVTTSSLTANETNALYTTNIVLTDTVLVAPTATDPYPVSPGGTVTFYDLYNGQTILLGSANVTPLIAGQAVAQLSTTGLMKGTHNISALYNANSTYAASTGTTIINITDYGVAFSPTYLTLVPGSGGATIATITAYNGFAGQVVLGCTPPAGEQMTCSFSPAVINISGTSVLSITTTAATAKMVRPARMGKAGSEVILAAISLGTLLLGLLLPGTRRRPTLLIALLAAMVLGVSMGCTTQGTLATPGNPTSGGGGTPQGTQLLSITTSGTDGVTTERHDVQFPVTVQ